MRRMFSEKQIREFADAQAKAVKKDISTLVDKDDHDRFIEGTGSVAEITGLNSSFCKWSLSGSHLMLVFAGQIANAGDVSEKVIASFDLPAWIYDKITPVWNVFIEQKSYDLIDNNWQDSQNLTIVLRKQNNLLDIITIGSFVATRDRPFRITFDLLIDNE